MGLKELCARNVSAAIREAANATLCAAHDDHNKAIPTGVYFTLKDAIELLEKAQAALAGKEQGHGG